ncbi:MAG: D-2-hydroxyacid dehydrogenase [Pirellula sp.]
MTDRASSFKIWTNAVFPEEVALQFRRAVSEHEIITAQRTSALNLAGSPPDMRLADADIAFGQPDANQLMQLTNLRWVHLTTAGYTAYDRDDLKEILRSRRIPLTTSSGVYDDPCAQHVLSMMMAFARQLPQSLIEQRTGREWPAAIRRRESFLLNGQTAILCGYGEIGTRLSELLQPFRMNLIGVRRKPTGDELIPTVSISQLNDLLPSADHVINLLPANPTTKRFFSTDRLHRMKSTAYFYNVGRGTTVDEDSLATLLDNQRLAGAYLDVTAVEPLPTEHPLWTLPNCFITPHTAGGFSGEMSTLVGHFLENLKRFQSGSPLLNRVI